MLTEQRYEIILKLLEEKNSITVSEVKDLLNTSESTVRRDITALHNAGKLVKVFGGAVALDRTVITHEPTVEQKAEVNVEAKQLVAAKAAALIQPEDFIYLDAGTTTASMLSYLTEKSATFVTNAVAHAKTLAAAGFRVYLVGGELKGSTEAVVGNQALMNLQSYHFTKGFFGTNGISRQSGLTTPDMNEAMVKKTAMGQCRECFILADHSKFGNVSSVTFGAKGNDVLGYQDLIDELTEKFPVGKPIVGEQNEKDYIKLYGKILRLKNILSTFDRFAGNELLPERTFQDYQSTYIDLYQQYRPKTDGDRENINDDIEFEVELIRQVEINIDYILALAEQFHASNCKNKEILGAIDRAIDSSIQLRSKKDLIQGFIDTMNASTVVERDWHVYVEKQKEEDLTRIITEEKLKPEEAKRFVDNSFRDGALKTTGIDFDKIMPPVSRFGSRGKNRVEKKQTIIQKLSSFFEKYLGGA